MDYFLITQDQLYSDAPRMADLNQKLKIYPFYNNDPHLMAPRTLIQISADEHVDFIDYLFQSVPLISERVMGVVRNFEDDFIHKQVILADLKNGHDRMYYIPFFQRFSDEVILSPDSPNVIERGKPDIDIKLKIPYVIPVFFVFWKEKCYLFMRLDVVESLLRNGCRGFTMREAEIIFRRDN